MGFIFGLLIGGMLSSGSGHVNPQQMLSAIPMRCLVAIEDGDDAYKKCRRISLGAEIEKQAEAYPFRVKDMKAQIDDGLNLEIRGLHEMQEAAKKKASH